MQPQLILRAPIRRRQPRVFAIAALGLCVGLVVNATLRPSADERRAATSPGTVVSPETLISAPPASSEAGLPRQLACTDPTAICLLGSDADASDQGRGAARRRAEVRALVAHVEKMRAITNERARYVHRILGDLVYRGAASVPAIRDFLRGGEDVDFADMTGGDLIGHRTLRQAFIDTLEQIGGSESVAVSLEELQRTTQPIEVAMFVRALEKEEPGLHSDEMIEAVGNTLEWAEHAPAKQLPDVSPLFDVLRAYGGEEAIPVLEACVPEWQEYALIALAGLPGGAGIPSLTTFAETPDGPDANAVLPFQMLAQAALQYPEAGDAIVDLAREGQIPDDVWNAMGDALAGKHLQFSGKMFDGTPLAENGSARSDARPSPWKSYYVEWMNVRYEQDVVSEGWSADQVAQQLALIDDLLETVTSPAAVQALQQARTSLRRDNST